MHRKHVILPGWEPVFACELLLFFRRPKPRIRDFGIGTRAFRATSFVISTAVIWYTVLFRQNHTDRPIGPWILGRHPGILNSSGSISHSVCRPSSSISSQHASLATLFLHCAVVMLLFCV